MSYDESYYKQRKTKIGQKQTINVQRLINAAVQFKNEADDLQTDLQDLEQREKESKKPLQKPKKG